MKRYATSCDDFNTDITLFDAESQTDAMEQAEEFYEEFGEDEEHTFAIRLATIDDIAENNMVVHLEGCYETGEGDVRYPEGFDNYNSVWKADVLQDWIIHLTQKYNEVMEEWPR